MKTVLTFLLGVMTTLALNLGLVKWGNYNKEKLYKEEVLNLESFEKDLLSYKPNNLPKEDDYAKISTQIIKLAQLSYSFKSGTSRYDLIRKVSEIDFTNGYISVNIYKLGSLNSIRFNLENTLNGEVFASNPDNYGYTLCDYNYEFIDYMTKEKAEAAKKRYYAYLCMMLDILEKKSLNSN